jgi:O-antigen/teichoic acid export membrane protein
MSFSLRYALTLFASLIRAGLNFLVSIQVAKYLMPELYGQYQYILSVSTAILLFINLNTESAFFTFISKRKQHFKFYLTYFGWQAFQIIFVFVMLIILDKSIYDLVFKNIDVSLISLVMGALFFVGNIQNTCNHLIESIRKTHFSQILSVAVALLHVFIVSTLIYFESLTILILFQVLLFEYFLYSLIVVILLKKYSSEFLSNEIFDLRDTLAKFYIYCRPLFTLALVGFLYLFVDRWLIQNYVGTEGQAYFSISMQFSALTILVTSSILRVFWKEIAESIEKKDFKKIKKYFVVVSEHLFVITCVISSVLFVYSDHLLTYFYTDIYADAATVFKLMMLYPILQSMGQLYSVFFLATEQTRLFKSISIGVSILSIAIAILFLADFGLGFGVEGIAIKLLMMNVMSSLILEFYIGKYIQSPINYFFRFKCLVMTFCAAFLIFKLQMYLEFSFVYQLLVVGCFYVLPIGLLLLNSLQKQILRE